MNNYQYKESNIKLNQWYRPTENRRAFQKGIDQHALLPQKYSITQYWSYVKIIKFTADYYVKVQ